MDVRSLPVAAVVATILAVISSSSPARAALTPAQKKELAAIRTELGHIKIPVKRDLIDESEKKTAAAEERLDALAKEAGLMSDDPHLASLRKMITARRDAIAKARDKEMKEAQKKGKSAVDRGSKKGNVAKKEGKPKQSFVANVAPIFVQHCLGCHGKEGKGGLRLDTFAGMERGGKSGPLLVEGEPANSLLIARLTAVGPARMPKDADPLNETECQTIADWISRGAKFDGDDRNKPLDKLAGAAPDKKRKATVKIAVARPTGSETVSFAKDIAPFMVERCLRCHSGNEPKGELSLETFEKLLEGGKSGPVIEPGNLAKSRMWDLVGEQKPFKMPPGDAVIKRSHWNSLRTWIVEGAKYDGDDPKRPLRSLVPSETERRNAELARITPQEMHEKRRQRSEKLWRRAFPKETAEHAENDAFLVYGNVSVERLEQTARWAADALQSVQSFFDDRTAPAFKGGLAIFVMKDRFSYEEFSQVVERRDRQAAIHGHAVVTPDLEDAYVVVQNLPDAASNGAPGARSNLIEQLAAAFLMRSEKKMPDWLVVGTGRVLSSSSSSSLIPASQWPQVYRLTGSLEKPDDMFVDGTFSPSAARDVGATLVAFLQDVRGKTKFVQFVKSMQRGTSQVDACRDVYGSELRGIAEAYVAHAAAAARRAGD